MMQTAKLSTRKGHPSAMGLMQSTCHKWPALSICLSVTAISFVLIFCVGTAGWPGPVTSNCYEDYLITPDCYCERLHGSKPGDVWFAQPMNTISNLWFIASGLLLAYATDSRKFPTKAWWYNNYNLVIEDNLYGIIYALNACLLGIGSICLHASFTTWGRQLDMISMYFIATFSVLYLLIRKGYCTKEQALWIYCWINTGLIYWTVRVATPEQTRRLFTSILLVSWMMEIFMIDAATARRNSTARKILFTNIGMFLSAVVVWKASESGGPICYPDSLFQGHSLWHLQSAVAIAGQFFYYLAEKGSPISMDSFEKLVRPRVSPVSDSSSESGSEASQN